MTSPHVVYRFFDAEGAALYVGSTSSVAERMHAHRRSSAWYPSADLARTEITECESHEQMVSTEESEITRLRPTHNRGGIITPYVAPQPRRASRLRNVRVPDDLWNQAKGIAEARYEKLSSVIRRALIEYVRAHEAKEQER